MCYYSRTFCIAVPQESPMDSPASSLHSPQPPLCCENGELARRLASSELDVIHLKDFLKQNTQKYTEDIKKLEEKVCSILDFSHMLIKLTERVLL